MDLLAQRIPSHLYPSKLAHMLGNGNTYNYGYIGSRAMGSEAGGYMVVWPDWKDATPPGIKKVFRSSTQFRWQDIAPIFKPDDLAMCRQCPAYQHGAV